MTAGDMPPATLTLTGPCQVNGSLNVPGDKSVSHRALLFGLLAKGTSTIHGLSAGDDVQRTLNVIRTLGASVTHQVDGTLDIAGGQIREPEDPLDHGNSGTGIRLTSGVVAGYDFLTVLTGDQFLRQRPMDRIADPLRAMGAFVDGRGGGRYAPLVIRGGGLRPISYRSPVASAQVKSAILLAGLRASGPTTVIEPVATRRHTEELLSDFGVDVVVRGNEVTVAPGALRATRVDVPGDPSQAAFWAVAGLTAPDSSVVIDRLYLGHGRGGFVTVLRGMGANIQVDTTTGSISAASAILTGSDVDPHDVAAFVDEIPVLAVAAAAARGTTRFSGAAELRVKESDRIASTVGMLKAFGVTASETPDGMVIDGTERPRAAVVDSHGDHRIAMAAAIAALRAHGTTVIHGWESVATSYPEFADELNRLTNGAANASIAVESRE